VASTRSSTILEYAYEEALTFLFNQVLVVFVIPLVDIMMNNELCQGLGSNHLNALVP
jgi:hypothetical protein